MATPAAEIEIDIGRATLAAVITEFDRP